MSLWSLPYAAARSWSGPSVSTRSFDCAEDAQPEHADGDDQHRGADERDEQLGVDLGRQAADGSDEPIVARAQRTALLDDGSSPFLHGSSLRHEAQGVSSVDPATMLVINHSSVDPRDVHDRRP